MGMKRGIPVEERRIYDIAMERIARFESPNKYHTLAFHNRAHTAGVMKRSAKIAQAAGLTDREKVLVRIAAAFHDVVQKFESDEREGGVIMRRRYVGMNEMESAKEALEVMRHSVLNFSGVELATVASAIIGTTPDWDPRRKTVFQPLVGKSSHLVAHCVALADIGEAGMDPESFTKTGYALFAEDNIDIMRVLEASSTVRNTPAGFVATSHNRLVAWMSTQRDFARGRSARVSKELAWLGKNADRVRSELFCHFAESERRALEEVEALRTMPFITAMRKLLPTAFPGQP